MYIHTSFPPPPSLQLLLSDDLTTIETLAKVCKDHHAELASTLIHIFIDYDRVVPIITACLGKSIESEGWFISPLAPPPPPGAALAVLKQCNAMLYIRLEYSKSTYRISSNRTLPRIEPGLV